MAGLVPAIHVFLRRKYVDARDKPGHDDHCVAIVSEVTELPYSSPPLSVTRRR